MTHDFDHYAGVDWASTAHRVCVLDGHGEFVGELDIAHDGSGLAQLCDWLGEMAGDSPGRLAVAIETPRGPVVETLL